MRTMPLLCTLPMAAGMAPRMFAAVGLLAHSAYVVACVAQLRIDSQYCLVMASVADAARGYDDGVLQRSEPCDGARRGKQGQDARKAQKNGPGVVRSCHRASQLPA